MERDARHVPQDLPEDMAERGELGAAAPMLVLDGAAEADNDVVGLRVVVAEEEDVVVAAGDAARADELHLEELVDVVGRSLQERVDDRCHHMVIQIVGVVKNHFERLRAA